MTNLSTAFSQATNYICLRDVKANNTAGGTFTSGAWQTRILTEEQADYGNHCELTLATSRFTLDPGTYICRISAPAFSIGRHKARLQNITGAATLLLGTSEYSALGAAYSQTRSFVSGIFTVAADQALEVQHYCQTTLATQGFGVESNFGVNEVYTVAKFLKVA